MYHPNSRRPLVSDRSYCDEFEATENIEVNWDKKESTCTIVSTDNSDWVQSVIVVQRKKERRSSRPNRHEVYGIMRKNTRETNVRSRGRSRCARESPPLDKVHSHSEFQSVSASDTSVSQSYDSSVQDSSFTSTESRVMNKAKGLKQKLRGFF